MGSRWAARPRETTTPAATEAATREDWLLKTDAEELLERARTSPIPEASGDGPV